VDYNDREFPWAGSTVGYTSRAEIGMRIKFSNIDFGVAMARITMGTNDLDSFTNYQTSVYIHHP